MRFGKLIVGRRDRQTGRQTESFAKTKDKESDREKEVAEYIKCWSITTHRGRAKSVKVGVESYSFRRQLGT